MPAEPLIFAYHPGGHQLLIPMKVFAIAGRDGAFFKQLYAFIDSELNDEKNPKKVKGIVDRGVVKEY